MSETSLQMRGSSQIQALDVRAVESLLLGIEILSSSDALDNQAWLTPASVSLVDAVPRSRDCAFYRLDELRHDSSFPQREAMENVLSALAGLKCRFVYLLSGDESGVSIHLGVVRTLDAADNGSLSANDLGSILHDAFAANFQGSSLPKLSTKELEQDIFERLRTSQRGGLVMGIPSSNEQGETQDAGFQGIERLINGMLGQRWQLLIVGQPMDVQEIEDIKRSVFSLYNQLHCVSKISIQQSENMGKSHTNTSGSNDSISVSKGSSSSSGDGTSSKGTNQGKSTTKGKNTSDSIGESSGYSLSMTQEKIKKELVDLLEYIDKELLDRIKLGQSKGMFKVATYALAENRADFWRLSQLIKSVFQGDTSRFSPLRVHPIPQAVINEASAIEHLLCGMRPWRISLNMSAEVPCLFGHPVESGGMSLSTVLTAKELSLLAGLPTREVPGIPMVEGVDFGVNPESSKSETPITVGIVLHRGGRVEGKRISLELNDLCRHVFVAGVTGSGKTTTCQKLLRESGLSFMVLEPAKTEYRVLVNAVPGLKIFTLGNERLTPLRLNPFELFRFETVTGHVDLLKAAFAAAFPMEAAMPYMLEDAIYRIYEKRGWDISGMLPAQHSNRLCADPWSPEALGWYWPTMDDLLIALGEVVDKEKFDTRLANDYRASLVSRLRNLTVGSKGSMLNCRISTDFEMLMNSQVVVEMDDLKDPQDKALLMGLILARVGEAVKERYRKCGGGTQHLTLIEEAHRLLAHPDQGSSDSRRHAVETFADMLAEIRKYGEGLVIVDQIPGKLMPEVLKNTNTKIVHKLFARDDREAVGDSMGLDDEQKNWLSRLKTGEVIVHSGQWLKPVHAMVEKLADVGEPDSEQLRRLFDDLYVQQQGVYFPALFCVHPQRLGSREEIHAFRELLGLIRHCAAEASTSATKTGREFCKRFCSHARNNQVTTAYQRLSQSFQGVDACLASELCTALLKNDIFESDLEEHTRRLKQFLHMAFHEQSDAESVIDNKTGTIIWNALYLQHQR
ncbi:MAG: hypothetical protein LHW56_08585 [Candidatus Cloacimonetes bacterium]|nr:hypothetical protein [Candidatus Cloacimonadota bacterium]MDY0172951.1 hypothetical protein [Candidatus Cloacimonadaceae bacterium]